MRIFAFSAVLLVVLAAFGVTDQAAGQGSVLTLDPPLTQVSLSGVEPLPDGTSGVINFGGTALNFTPVPVNTPTGTPPTAGIYWNANPASPLDNLQEACGFITDDPPTALVTLPDGQQQSIPPQLSSLEPRCYSITIPWTLGMELGNYTVQVDYAGGQITKTVTIDDTVTCQILVKLPATDSPNSQQFLLMGFPPSAALTLNFYNLKSIVLGSFVATRSIQTDADGAAAIQIAVARSAPFTIDRVSVQVQGLYRDSWGIFRTNKVPGEPLMHCAAKPRTASSNSICPGTSPASRLTVGEQARVVDKPLPNRLRSTPEGDTIGLIPPGGMFTVLDGPQCGPANGLVWWKVNYNGSVGWTAEGENGEYYLEPMPAQP